MKQKRISERTLFILVVGYLVGFASLLSNIAAGALTFIPPWLALALFVLITGVLLIINLVQKGQITPPSLLKVFITSPEAIVIINVIIIIVILAVSFFSFLWLPRHPPINHLLPSPTSTFSTSSPGGTPTCQTPAGSIQGEITQVRTSNKIIVTLYITFTSFIPATNATANGNNMPVLSMSLGNTQNYAAIESEPLPIITNGIETFNSRFDFAGLNTTPGTSYQLSWKITSHDPADPWTCVFPQETITLQ